MKGWETMHLSICIVWEIMEYNRSAAHFYYCITSVDEFIRIATFVELMISTFSFVSLLHQTSVRAPVW